MSTKSQWWYSHRFRERELLAAIEGGDEAKEDAR